MDSQIETDSDGNAAGQRFCPACGSAGRALDFALSGIPTNSVRIHASPAQARSVRCGDMDLYGCAACGFIWNAVFDPARVDYSAGYEGTQSYSKSYRSFMRAQAAQFMDAFDLHGRTIIEIGCGHGEFLSAICEMGDNIGVGYDPAFRADRAPAAERGRYTVLAEKFGRETIIPDADLICCRNTLEHLSDVQAFVRDLRQALRSPKSPRIVFQVPAWERIEAVGAFWDIYYEHCSYFSAESLETLFTANGFSVERTGRVFEDQYLLIEARPVDTPSASTPARNRTGALQTKIGERLCASRERWSARVAEWRCSGRTIMLWGGGSKAVAFLSAVGTQGIAGAIDINPNKWRTYLPQSALPVVSPDDLETLRPGEIVIMNAAYAPEIAGQIAAMGLDANLSSLD